MKVFTSYVGIGLLWQVVLLIVSTTNASPTISPRLIPRQAVSPSQSSASNNTAIHGISNATQSLIAAGSTASGNLSQINSLTRSMSSSNATGVNSGGGDATTVPMVNSPIVLPAFSACTSRDKRTVTFTSEFAHHTGFETIGDEQGFWNDSGAVWVVKVVSLDYSIQALGTFDDTEEALSSSAITAGSASTAFTINVPTQGCESMYIPSFSAHRLSKCAGKSVSLTCALIQSPGLLLAGLLNLRRRHPTLPVHIHLASQANTLALRTQSSTPQNVLMILL